MRIIAGKFKGRKLLAPKGNDTRPTTDRIRESLMSTLTSMRGGFEGAQVLDAFAGSGALGFEALSRGAETVTFYEKSAGAIRVLRTNAAALGLGLSDHAIYQGDVMKHYPRFVGRPFDLVFLDPPYTLDYSEILKMIKLLYAQGVLAKNALISYEHSRKTDLRVEEELNTASWDIVSRKKYGDTTIDLLQHQIV